MAETITEHENAAEIPAEKQARKPAGNEQPGAGTGAGSGAGTRTGKRKRTAAARAKRTAEAVSATPEIAAQEIETDNRPAKAAKRNPKARAKDRSVGSENAAVLLSLLDGLAVSVAGADAAMNPFERMMIQEPLERILGRLSWETGETVNRWMDPILLTIGLIGWGGRLVDLYKEKHSRPALADDGLYGPKTPAAAERSQAKEHSQAPAAAAPAAVDLGTLSNAPLPIGREAERVQVDYDLLRTEQ